MVRMLTCSFCGKSERQVARLLAGAHGYICDDCVESCAAILAAAPRHALEGDAMLASLAACDAAVTAAREVLRRRVDELRSRQVSWEQIGTALGVSRQAAWERFR